MRTAAARLGILFGIKQRDGMVLAAGTVAALAVAVTAAARLGLLVPTAGASIALLVLVLSLRWPLLPLFLYVAVIPVEEVLVIEGVGTVARIAAILFILTYSIPRLGRLDIRAMPPAGWAFLAWSIVSIGWALDPARTAAAIPPLVLLFVTGVLIAAVVAEQPSVVRPLLWVYAVASSITAAIGLYTFILTGAPGGARVSALQDDPAHFAAILLPALIFGLYELVRGRLLPLSAVVTLLCGAGVLISGTRGAWVGAAIAIAVFMVPRLGPRQIATAGAMLIIFVVGSLQVPGIATLITDRTETALSSGGAGRTDIWSVGITIYSSAPVTGVGLANFPVAYTPERVRETDVGEYAATRPTNLVAHSIVIGTLGELGLVGLILLAWFLVPLILRPGWGSEGPVLQAIIAGLVIDALFLDLLARKQVWLMIGLACGLGYVAVRETHRWMSREPVSPDTQSEMTTSPEPQAGAGG